MKRLKVVKESHLDHGLDRHQVDYLRDKCGEHSAFFIETIELPLVLGSVPCGLHGPLMGDAPVLEAVLVQRGERSWASRVVDRPTRKTRLVTVIGGPHGDDACVLYTAFGGPLTPQEPGDPGCKDVDASTNFWAEHALSK